MSNSTLITKANRGNIDALYSASVAAVGSSQTDTGGAYLPHTTVEIRVDYAKQLIDLDRNKDGVMSRVRDASAATDAAAQLMQKKFAAFRSAARPSTAATITKAPRFPS